MRTALHTSFALLLSFVACAFANPTITTQRVPNNGLEPQVSVDSTGTVHLIYFKGDPGHGDVFYTRSSDSGKTFQPSLHVNSQRDSALIVGSVRGPQLSLGREDRPHVIWTSPRGALLYSRLIDGSFQPQREITTGIDGGGSVAADARGNVYVVWHAPQTKESDEGNRRIYVARSTDDGKTFAPPIDGDAPHFGACGCCAVRAFISSDGTLRVLYRTATQMVHRDMFLLAFDKSLQHVDAQLLDSWKSGKCVMSTAAASGGLIAYETSQGIEFDRLALIISEKNAKHPAVASAGKYVLCVWTEGTGWNKGGEVKWVVYETAQPREVMSSQPRGAEVPVWGTPAAFATPQGNFVILY